MPPRMSTTADKAYTQRRDLFMNLTSRERLKKEILTQARWTLRQPRNADFDVVLKQSTEANADGTQSKRWNASLIVHVPGMSSFGKFDRGVTHASREEALSWLLSELEETELRGSEVDESGKFEVRKDEEVYGDWTWNQAEAQMYEARRAREEEDAEAVAEVIDSA